MYTIAIHGGSGTINRSEITPEQEKQFRQGLEAALDAGYHLLARGGSALDAVEQAVRSLEENAISLARAVMEQSENVFLLGAGAEEFAREHKLTIEPDDYFFSELRFEQLKQP